MNIQNNESKFYKLTLVRTIIISILILFGLCLINKYNKLGFIKPWLFILISSILLLVILLPLIFRKKLTKYINNSKFFQTFDITTFTCFIILIFIFLNTYVLSFTSVEGSSMEPSLYENDRVIVTSLFYKPETNDVIAFDATGYEISSHDYLCKRIVATSGDLITVEDIGNNLNVYVNSELILQNIPKYRYETMITYFGDGTNEVCIIDENHIVMDGYSIIIGDNLPCSIDSRDFGAVKNEDILGRVVFRYFSENGKIKVVR